MNAKLLERLVQYREVRGLEFARTIMYQKITYQFSILGMRKLAEPFLIDTARCTDIKTLMLTEARAAKLYWRNFGSLIRTKAEWKSRVPHGTDPCNKLLDIGYHYLTQIVKKTFDEIDMPSQIGIFHKAQSKSANPLVYDFIEWLRPIVVDYVILHLLRKKKKIIGEISNGYIGQMLGYIKKRLSVKFFHNELGYCITLGYWIRMNAAILQGAVHHGAVFDPHFPSLRHETRCRIVKPIPAIAMISQ